ncbi:MAG: hypothetical protein ACOYMF_05450 [Bacteroidales bacterium]
MEKTALQQLIEDMEEISNKLSPTGNDMTVKLCACIASFYLKSEKQQIMDAYWKGHSYMGKDVRSDDYYKHKFGK